MFYDGVYKYTVLYLYCIINGHNYLLLHRLSNIHLKVNIRVTTSLFAVMSSNCTRKLFVKNDWKIYLLFYCSRDSFAAGNEEASGESVSLSSETSASHRRKHSGVFNIQCHLSVILMEKDL